MIVHWRVGSHLRTEGGSMKRGLTILVAASVLTACALTLKKAVRRAYLV
jgi:hypothetical protein